eukprot:5637710-Pyramimonas_sp.AAC.1
MFRFLNTDLLNRLHTGGRACGGRSSKRLSPDSYAAERVVPAATCAREQSWAWRMHLAPA